MNIDTHFMLSTDNMSYISTGRLRVTYIHCRILNLIQILRFIINLSIDRYI